MNRETEPTTPANPDAKIFVLVHGGAHGAWAFERLTSLLVQEGHYVVARDLPGHGLGARFPRSYATRPLNPQEFATEPSPIAHLTLRDYRDQVTASIRRLAERMPHSQIILLGHSMAGLVLNQVGEAVPELIGRLVYLSAWMTADGTSFSDYMVAPEFSTGLIPSILLSDPAVTGALRMDFCSSDPEYRARVKAAFAADVDDHDWDAITNLLTPDTPAGPLAEPVTITPDRWGRIPRTYIMCTDDHAVPPAAQWRFINEADKHTPDNPRTYERCRPATLPSPPSRNNWPKPSYGSDTPHAGRCVCIAGLRAARRPERMAPAEMTPSGRENARSAPTNPKRTSTRRPLGGGRRPSQ